ncbi:hypothetical protein JOC36_001475 [Weissella uvarum]|uniref:hypothetical protein n=1 Tax=Weissella uvarum TaxID=1479233 RepID=UPI0019618BBE|nr:hypothetical protein [Weissella uvarum]MBM7617882.1 hypothetical protein [Weissella uvarum]MCM0596120.1 hypothetical protein [Weissella uvarum]
MANNDDRNYEIAAVPPYSGRNREVWLLFTKQQVAAIIGTGLLLMLFVPSIYQACRAFVGGVIAFVPIIILLVFVIYALYKTVLDCERDSQGNIVYNGPQTLALKSANESLAENMHYGRLEQNGVISEHEPKRIVRMK